MSAFRLQEGCAEPAVFLRGPFASFAFGKRLIVHRTDYMAEYFSYTMLSAVDKKRYALDEMAFILSVFLLL